MSKMKPPISFGLPGRLSIFGFDQEEAGIGIRRFSGWFLLASALLLAALTVVLLWLPEQASLVRQWPLFIWPAAGIFLALTSWTRSRLASILLLAAWIAFAVYFVPNEANGKSAATPARQTVSSPAAEQL